MQTFHALKQAKKHYQQWIGMAALLAGLLALCRGLAEAGVISHLTLGHPGQAFHLVIY
jgi:hypothetical protein